MSQPIASFANLLAPFRTDSFFDQYWERKPLHIRRAQGDVYASLLTQRDVEAAISAGGLRYPSIQVARDGGFLPPELFTRSLRSGGDVFTGIPDLDRVRAEYEAGATITLPGFHRSWRPLGALAGAIEAEFSHPVHTNVYLTPGGTAGFAPHYDTHEVFVLQIAGAKRWRVERPPLALPHRSQVFDPRGYAPSAPFLELELAPGDLLYLPRGHIHTTTTSTGFSLHVTLGITVYTWVDLIAEWAQTSRHLPSLRRALPVGFASRPELRQSLGEALDQAIQELQRSVSHGTLVDGFARRIEAAQGRSREDFRSDVMADRDGRRRATEQS